jgi:hypothetical protein
VQRLGGRWLLSTGVELTIVVSFGILLIGVGSALLMWSRRPTGR